MKNKFQKWFNTKYRYSVIINRCKCLEKIKKKKIFIFPLYKQHFHCILFIIDTYDSNG